jgi:hypothetical protein
LNTSNGNVPHTVQRMGQSSAFYSITLIVAIVQRSFKLYFNHIVNIEDKSTLIPLVPPLRQVKRKFKLRDILLDKFSLLLCLYSFVISIHKKEQKYMVN